MRIMELGTRGKARASVGVLRDLLLRFGLAVLATGAMIGVAWFLADAGSSAEAADGPVAPAEYVPAPVSLVDEVSGVVETPLSGRTPGDTAAKLVSSLGGTVSDVADDTAGRIEPVTGPVLDTLACGKSARACAEDRPTGSTTSIKKVTGQVTRVVRSSSTFVGDLARRTVDTPVDALPLTDMTETSAHPVPSVVQDLTAVFSPLLGALSTADASTDLHGAGETVAPETGTAVDCLPQTAEQSTRTDTISSGAAAAPDLTSVHVGEPHFPVISAAKAGQGLPGAPVGPLSAYLDLGNATGTSVSRTNAGDHLGDDALPPARAWFGSSHTGLPPTGRAFAHPAEWVAEYAVVPD